MFKKNKKFTIALCYDFDGTLSPGNMQEYAFIPSLQQSVEEFWTDTNALAKSSDADLILAYMYLMCKRAKEKNIQIRKSDFEKFGKGVEFFSGILPEQNKPDWFERINGYAANFGAEVKHYIISSGLKEMIEGTPIASKFDKIYASSFMYDENGSAMWPAQAVNYTTKMQYLFRINKGVLDIQRTINHYMKESERPVPFNQMIYFGDGMTDIPSMKLVKTQGGYSVAVHDGSKKSCKSTEKLLNENRVHFVAKADYSEGSALDLQVKRVVSKICAQKWVDANE